MSLDEKIFNIIEHPKAYKECEELAYDMFGELARDGIILNEYEYEEDEYEESRRSRESRIRRRSRLNYRR